MAQRVSINRIKKDKSYTAEELADVVQVTVGTVHRWAKDGLATLDGERPKLFMGFSVLSYIKDRQSKNKQPMAWDEFYCLRCKTPRKPFGMMADYQTLSATGGRLTAICSVCEATCKRNVSAKQLAALEQSIDIQKL